jgi:hypothetical protein
VRLLPIVPASGAPPSGVPGFVRHCGVAALLWRSADAVPGELPSIVVAREVVAHLPRIGIRVVIAPGFDARFFSEAVREGILPVALPADTIDAMGARLEAAPRERITVDLEGQTIEVPGLGSVGFETPARVRRKLLHGLDDLDELLEHRDVAAAFRTGDMNRRPWLYASAPLAPPRDRDPNDG